MELILKGRKRDFRFAFGSIPQNSKITPDSSTQDRTPAITQVREAFDNDCFSGFNRYLPFLHNLGYYNTVRATMPYFDIAINKLIKLTGKPQIKAVRESNQPYLDEFIRTVNVNWTAKGLQAYLNQLQDSTFEYGMGFGETVFYDDISGIHRLKVCSARDIVFMKHEGRLVFGAYRPGSIMPEVIDNQELIHYLAYDQRGGHPQGYSLLYSCTHATQVFYRWMKAFEKQVERFGDITVIGLFNGGPNTKSEEIKTAKNNFATAMASHAMKKKRGQKADLAIGIPGGGSVDIKTLGSDVDIIGSADDIKTILELLIAKTGLPPYMFGVSWSARQTMTHDQADMVASNTMHYRECLNPIIEKVINDHLIATKKWGIEYTIEWGPVLLMDEKEINQAKLFEMKAMETFLKNLIMMIENELINSQEAQEMLERNGYKGFNFSDSMFTAVKNKQYLRSIIGEYFDSNGNGKYKNQRELVKEMVSQ